MWPPPDCRGPHKNAEVYRRWQHNAECKRFSEGYVTEGRIATDPVLRAFEDDNIVQRARVSGGI